MLQKSSRILYKCILKFWCIRQRTTGWFCSWNFDYSKKLIQVRVRPQPKVDLKEIGKKTRLWKMVPKNRTASRLNFPPH